MIDALPTVQRYRRVKRIVDVSKNIRGEKRIAHRSRRRAIRAAGRAIARDLELWFDETFDGRSLSSWDLA